MVPRNGAAPLGRNLLTVSASGECLLPPGRLSDVPSAHALPKEAADEEIKPRSQDRRHIERRTQ